MRCPKCQYISFDHADRCRNCGYDFSLTPESEETDLPIRTGDEPLGPLADFSLMHAAPPPDAVETPPAEPTPREERPSRGRAPRNTPAELPLFGATAVDQDAPLVSLPAAPRAPVAVRKSSPSPRPAAAQDDDAPRAVEATLARAARSVTEDSADLDRSTASDAASPLARLMAALTDVLVIGLVDVGILAVTLRACDLAWSEIDQLPAAPFLAFLLLLNGGYLTVFTAAGGQTVGKMAAHIKVVTADTGIATGRVPLGQATLRVAAYLASLLPLGLGFLPAFVGAERRAVHDRIAHTRVVRA